MSARTMIEVCCVTNDGQGESSFATRSIELHGSPERSLSEQLPALNFRLRTSHHAYSSDWHVAGDPTLLIMLSGTIRIVLRNGETRDFSAGEMFIAQDFLATHVQFNDGLHGHRAEVVGGQDISVLHLKLSKSAA